MDMIQLPPRIITDLDEAMGELLHLFGTAAELQRIDRYGFRTGPMPHQLDENLFYACWRVVNAQRFETATFCIQLLFEIYLPDGNMESREHLRRDAKRLRRS